MYRSETLVGTKHRVLRESSVPGFYCFDSESLPFLLRMGFSVSFNPSSDPCSGGLKAWWCWEFKKNYSQKEILYHTCDLVSLYVIRLKVGVTTGWTVE